MKKHWRYLVYVVRHKFFVFVAGLKTQAPLLRLIIHDWSKFLPCEWFPYVEYFYGKRAWLEEHEADDCRYWELAAPYIAAFDRAWLHHQHQNAHHWQHWVLREDDGQTKLLPIPEKFLREMVADWMGAGRAITGKWNTPSWYVRNRERIQLSDDNRRRVEQMIGLEAIQEVEHQA